MNLFGEEQDLIAIERIKTFCPPEGYYVAFSGGKDSVVIFDLVKRSGVPFDAHYNLTTVDPPELVYFVRTFPEVQIDKPNKTMWELIVKNGVPPTMIMRYCCAELKEHGGDGRFVITGVRWQEGTRRAKRKMNEVCFKDSRKFYLHPIIDWKTSDVWNYIKKNNLRYCSLYDEGFKRLGCVLCPMNPRREIEAERWPKIKAAYIRAFDKTVRENPNARHETGQAMYDWWIKHKRNTYVDPDQTVLFE